ncbi:MAG: transcriptional regulator, partial [Acetobacteraceae bacterium]
MHRQIEMTADPALLALAAELARYPAPRPMGRSSPVGHEAVAVPLRLRVGGRELALFSTVTVFGTPLDI